MSDENNVYYDNDGSNGSQNNESNGMAIASMICGILSIITCCIWYASIPLGIVSIVLGILHLRKSQKKGMAIAGIICSAIGILFAVGILILAVFGYSLLESGAYDSILRDYGVY